MQRSAWDKNAMNFGERGVVFVLLHGHGRIACTIDHPWTAFRGPAEIRRERLVVGFGRGHL